MILLTFFGHSRLGKALMVLDFRTLLMDEIETTRLLSQALTLPKSKFHNEKSTQQHPLTALLQKIPIVADEKKSTSPSTEYQLHRQTSISTTPRSRSISSSNPINEFLKPHSILSQNNSSESDDDDDSSHHDEINLYPLSNQVGGHTRLLLLNEKTVIKPLNIRELEFYQNIPSDIQHFVPNYKGEYLSKSQYSTSSLSLRESSDLYSFLKLNVLHVNCEMKVKIKIASHSGVNKDIFKNKHVLIVFKS